MGIDVVIRWKQSSLNLVIARVQFPVNTSPVFGRGGNSGVSRGAIQMREMAGRELLVNRI